MCGDVLTRLIGVIISQYRQIAKHYVVCCIAETNIALYVNYISIIKSIV